MKRFHVEITVSTTTTVVVETENDDHAFDPGFVDYMIGEGKCELVVHTIFPLRHYQLIREEVV